VVGLRRRAARPLAHQPLGRRLGQRLQYRADAQDSVAEDPRRALEQAEDSLALNDESLPAYYAKAAALARLNDYRGARAALGEATRREPHDWVTWGLLGDIAVRRGDLAQARRDYGQASELNPRDTGLQALAKNPRAGLPQ
jgi:Flp pilus assembly protein TadD